MRPYVVAARSTLVVVFSIGLLLTSTVPAFAAKAPSAAVTACTPDNGASIQISITWSGFTANEWSAGVSDNRGQGLAVLVDFDPAVNGGMLTQTVGLPIDPSEATRASAGVYFNANPDDPSAMTAGPSGTVRRHGKAAWPSC